MSDAKIPFNTFAEFKRLAQVGAKVRKEYYGVTDLPPMIKTINHRQSNAVAFAVDEDSTDRGYTNRSWLYFPKAGAYLIQEDRLIFLDTEKRPYFSYSFIQANQ